MALARPAQRQRGVALIVILMLLAIMVSIAATMSGRLFTQFKRAGNQLNYQQAYWYAIGAESLAKAGIEQSYQDSDTINLSQPWALEEQTYPLDYGRLKGRILDRQACFNVNALASVEFNPADTGRPYLVSVLKNLLTELEVDDYQAEVMADSTWEFVDKNDGINSQSGVEDAFYEGLAPPYMAANTLLADESELRAVNQMSGEAMTKLAPYVCALPADDWRLNINTLEPEQSKLLMAMFSPYLSDSDAKAILERRPYDGWASVEDFLAEPAIASVDENVRKQARQYLAVDSAYFELDAEVLVEESRVRIRSLLYSENRETATVIRRRFGGISERVSDRSTE